MTPLAIDSLYRTHQDYLVSRLTRRLPADRQLVEDAVSFAWMQLVRKPPPTFDPESIRAWLFTVALHEAYRLTRLASREQPTGQPEGGVSEPLELRMDARDALDAVARLSTQWHAIWGDHIAGFSYNEIVERRGVSWSKVNRYLSTGRRAVRAAAVTA